MPEVVFIWKFNRTIFFRTEWNKMDNLKNTVMKKDNQKEQSKKEKPAANKTAAKATDDKDTARNQYSGSGDFGSDDNETTNTKDGQLNKGKTIVDSQVPENGDSRYNNQKANRAHGPRSKTSTGGDTNDGQ